MRDDLEVAARDPSGAWLVHPNRGSANLAFVASGRPEGPLSLAEVERADRLGTRALLGTAPCGRGEVGRRLRYGGVRLRVRLGKVELVSDARVDVIDRGESACLARVSARLSATGEDVMVRVDLQRERADVVDVETHRYRRDLRCELAP